MTIVFEYCETFWLLYEETDAIVCFRKPVIRMSLSECFQNFAIKRRFKKRNETAEMCTGNAISSKIHETNLDNKYNLITSKNTRENT